MIAADWLLDIARTLLKPGSAISLQFSAIILAPPRWMVVAGSGSFVTAAESYTRTRYGRC